MKYLLVLVYLSIICHRGHPIRAQKWSQMVNLPPEHLAFFFHNNPTVAHRCRHDSDCPYKMHLDRPACWGYEPNCTRDRQYSYPSCMGDHNGWVHTKSEQYNMFYEQGDFGYIRERQRELFPICKPRAGMKDDSILECSKYLRFCRGKEIFFNFSSLIAMSQPMRYRMDVIQERQIGGACTVDNKFLKAEIGHMSPLQSWAPELHNFVAFDKSPLSSGKCDSIVTKPTFIMKLDATVNMYHHFCDFFNLYATLHLNNTFTTDIHILIWDTMSYQSNFGVTWKAFTRHPIQDLKQYVGKTVCFRDVVFPLLPRMIYGMYYNMPLIDGCENSGLFHAFSHHVLHRLGISQDAVTKNSDKIRVKILSRSTAYRQILNEDKLIKALQSKNEEFVVQKVDFHWKFPFIEQLRIIHNTDILVGMHGAGLTHMLFLPDWAAVFEIYNCEDESCYRDLARLRGVRYFTWEKMNKMKPQDKGHHPTEGAHAKFTNYEFDVREFLRIMMKAVVHVRSHPLWHPNTPEGQHSTPYEHTEL